MADLKTGKLTQIIGAVLDIKFPEGGLPEINDAVNVPLEDGKKLVVEVAQHLGDDTVRCIARSDRWTEAWHDRRSYRRSDQCSGW